MTTPYINGANLGGWLVLENWLFPNVPLLRLGPHGPIDNQEWDYIARLCERGMDAVATMHRHWNTYLSHDLLHSRNPPQKLIELQQMGVTELRIPVGWWAFMAPESASCDCFGSECRSRGSAFTVEETDGEPATPWVERGAAREGRGGSSSSAGRGKGRLMAGGLEAYEQPGLTEDGFVTGGSVYLRALLKWCGRLNMTAVIDMHALPGGAVKKMGYTGRYFSEARFFTGADAWYADGNASSLPSRSMPFLRTGVRCLLRLARFIAALDAEPHTRGVVRGLAPWNEALFADDLLAAKLLPPFTLKLLPQLRAVLPAERYAIWLNWFNWGRDWPAWMHEQRTRLGDNVVAELHMYHAFDPPFDPANPLGSSCCGMCTGGVEGMRSLICKSCGTDAPLFRRYREEGVPFVVGEWSLGSCGMWGRHPNTIDDADFLYAWYAATKSSMSAGGAGGDYFWSGVVRTGGYDPTVYNKLGVGSRVEVEAELRRVAEQAEWLSQNQYVAECRAPVEEGYLLNWHLSQLSRVNTSSGHPIAMRAIHVNASEAQVLAADGGAPRAILMHGSCQFSPKVPARISGVMHGRCDLCRGSFFYPIAAALTTLALGAVLAVACLIRCALRRRAAGRVPEAAAGGSGGGSAGATALGAAAAAAETAARGGGSSGLRQPLLECATASEQAAAVADARSLLSSKAVAS